jgi:two-component system chemotaxis response regulator CheY
MRALVIDDSKAMRIILKGVLKQVGFGEVLEAENGRQGLDLLTANPTMDCVLVDWYMPEMDGRTFIRTVRADPGWDGLPVIMVTSESDAANMASALLAGASEYVIKPFTRDAIVEKLQILGLAGTMT